LILATTYALEVCRYFYTDTKQIIRKIGKFPEVINEEKLENSPDSKIPNKAYIFKAFSIKNPTENKVAVFYNKADRAEFYANDKLTKIAETKEKFYPEMEITKLEKGFSVQDYDKTKYAYLSVTHDENYIYTLYSGSAKTCSNRVFVFDWSGNFIEEIALNREVCKIYINPKTKILYCYEDKENGIFSANLDF
jgi:hypothetical protein